MSAVQDRDVVSMARPLNEAAASSEPYTVRVASRNLVVLSDGTGNSAAKPFKTNVWRLYQALDLTDGSQVAVFGDGVGTSSVRFLRVLGLALGVGVNETFSTSISFSATTITAAIASGLSGSAAARSPFECSLG
jgi:hypothetical protein